MRICKWCGTFTRLRQVSREADHGAIGRPRRVKNNLAVPGGAAIHRPGGSMSTFNHGAGGRKPPVRRCGVVPLSPVPPQLLLCPFLRRRASLVSSPFTFCQVKPLVPECLTGPALPSSLTLIHSAVELNHTKFWSIEFHFNLMRVSNVNVNNLCGWIVFNYSR